MRKHYRSTGIFVLAAILSMTTSGVASAMTSEEQIEAQQVQIDKQANEIAELKKQVQMLLEMSGKNEKMLAEKVDKAEIEDLKTDKMVTSKSSKAKVTLYGQVNRAGLWADNGDDSTFYFVDNDNSSTRMGVQADAKLASGQGIGGKIEYELESNPSNSVNQLEQSVGPDIKLRHADLWFKGVFGKLAIGRGSTATDGTAESDLSGTSVVTYSNIEGMSGGQLWYDSASSMLSEIEVGDVFNNMDGLSRSDRFRYDTPSLAGFSVSASAVEESAYDIAARYSRKFDGAGLKLAAALGWADGGDLKSFDDQVSGSFSVLHDSGFNVTFAAGQQSFSDEEDQDDPSFWYGKLGYQAQFFALGKSSFSIDYGQFSDFEASGDEADVFSLAYVQKVDDWASELYIAYRLHSLDSTGFDYDDVSALIAGARVKF